jgi:transposase InsO family protein
LDEGTEQILHPPRLAGQAARGAGADALPDRQRLPTQVEARTAAFDFIEGGYSAHRRHSALDHLSPISYERRHEHALQASAPENGFAGCPQSHDHGSA